MEEKYLTDCPLMYSEICECLGCDGCDACTFRNGIGDMNAEELINRHYVTTSLIPSQADHLHETDSCLFCKSNPPEQKDFYAILSLGHPEPAFEKGRILGIGKKVRMPIGSLIEVPITICKSCRKRFLTRDLIQIIGSGISIAIAIILLLIPGLEAALEQIHWIMPPVVLGVIIAAGCLASYGISNTYLKKQADKMHINPLDIPDIQAFTQAGWFPLAEKSDQKKIVRVHISKRKPRENFYFHKKRTN